MSGGSARPRRRKAVGASLRYEHRPGRAREEGPKERVNWGFGCLVILGFLTLIAPLILVDRFWSHDIWGRLAPAWPGGSYAFAATVGALVPVALAAFVAPPTRLNWRRNKGRSLAWAAGALPGPAGGYLLAGVIGATWRPKRNSDWYSECYGRGGPCWVHEQYPYVWAVGLTATLAVIALLVWALVRYFGRKSAPVEESLGAT
jgi:hypothetical protein